jgi:DNA recombination protein RmuC
MLTWLPVIVTIVIALAVFWFVKRELTFLKENLKPDDSLVEWLKNQQKESQRSSQFFNQTLAQTNQNIQQVLSQNTKTINQRLDNATKYISQVSQEVGKMSEIGRSMQELQEFLKSPKLRGNIGEEVLKDLIGQMFPKSSFHLQYQFKTGNKVDAALKTEAGILPIDSKFPMENFTKMSKAPEAERKLLKRQFITDVKKHIKAISEKYILPDEGTVDFALMYIPSESVFYEVINDQTLFEYARQNRVYIVSPSSLYAHLRVILLSFEGKQIESQTRQVFRMLQAIQKDYQKMEGNLTVLGKHVNNAQSKMNEVFQGFSILGNKITNAIQLPRPEEKEKKGIEE